MTGALKLAIRTTLTNDSQYITAMSSPTSAPYNTYYKQPPNPPSFPQVVFWLRPGSNNKDMNRNLLSINYDLHVWIWTQSGNQETISNRIIYLFHQKGNSSEGFRIIYDRELDEVYDQDLNAWGVHLLFNLFHRREII